MSKLSIARPGWRPFLLASVVGSASLEIPPQSLSVCLAMVAVPPATCSPDIHCLICARMELMGPCEDPSSGRCSPAVDNPSLRDLATSHRDVKWRKEFSPGSFYRAKCQPQAFGLSSSEHPLFMENESLDSLTHKWTGNLGINNTTSWNAMAAHAIARATRAANLLFARPTWRKLLATEGRRRTQALSLCWRQESLCTRLFLLQRSKPPCSNLCFSSLTKLPRWRSRTNRGGNKVVPHRDSQGHPLTPSAISQAVDILGQLLFLSLSSLELASPQLALGKSSVLNSYQLQNILSKIVFISYDLYQHEEMGCMCIGGGMQGHRNRKMRLLLHFDTFFRLTWSKYLYALILVASCGHCHLFLCSYRLYNFSIYSEIIHLGVSVLFWAGDLPWQRTCLILVSLESPGIAEQW